MIKVHGPTISSLSDGTDDIEASEVRVKKVKASEFEGNVKGNLEGNVKGNLEGNVTGNVRGNTVGNVLSEVLTLQKTITPTPVKKYCKLYCKEDDKLYFMDSKGIEHEVLLKKE